MSKLGNWIKKWFVRDRRTEFEKVWDRMNDQVLQNIEAMDITSTHFTPPISLPIPMQHKGFHIRTRGTTTMCVVCAQNVEIKEKKSFQDDVETIWHYYSTCTNCWLYGYNTDQSEEYPGGFDRVGFVIMKVDPRELGGLLTRSHITMYSERIKLRKVVIEETRRLWKLCTDVGSLKGLVRSIFAEGGKDQAPVAALLDYLEENLLLDQFPLNVKALKEILTK